jgi:amino acid permease
MGKVVYDFREGLDLEKIVYKNDGINWKECIYYTLCIIGCWVYTAGWFALFHYAYINSEPTAFWIYVGIWLGFAIFLVIVIGYNLGAHYHRKAIKKIEQEKENERKRLQEEEEKRNREARHHKHDHHEREEMVELGTMNNLENQKLKNE